MGIGSVELWWNPDAPPLTTQQRQLASEIWDQTSGKFNGSLLTYQRHQQGEAGLSVYGTFTEYRFYFAQKQSGQDFGIAPIGVSGMLICHDHLIFARRSPQVTAYPGYYELVPSGSIDREVAHKNGKVDFMKQLQTEFVEEVGLPAETIQSMHPLGLVYDPADPVYDIACEIHIKTPLEDLMHALGTSEEYETPLALPLTDIENVPEDLIPTSHALIQLWKYHHVQ